MANSLVLHDFKGEDLDIPGWFYYVEDWFHRCGVVPNRIGGKSKKNITFVRGKKRLEKEQFTDIGCGIWIGALPLECTVEMFDFLCAAELEANGKRKTMVMTWDDQLVGFNPTYLTQFAQDMYRFFEPAYGYCFQRLFRQGPGLYPFGFLSGIDKFSEEADRIDRWGKEYKSSYGTYRTGLFRDIYPMNFVCMAHLDQRLGEQRLQDWITSDSSRGELTALNDKLWSWWIPEHDIAGVREALKPTGLLLCA
ncbi:MAG: hypothetical protein ACK5VW_06825 [Holosporales bacterium]